MNYYVYQVFQSIQGESYLVGTPTVFVRMSFCNLRCSYCDEKQALKKGFEISTEDLLTWISSYQCKTVCLTGGEPLFQENTPKLIDELIRKGYHVSLETNGTFPLKHLNKKLIRVMDLKLEVLKKHKKTILANLRALGALDELKIIIKNIADYKAAVKIINKYKLYDRTHVSMSPLFGKVDTAWLADKIINDHLPIRLNVQLHKYIWPNDYKGR